MPKLDTELTSKGYKPFLPADIFKASSVRGEGFLNSFLEGSKLSNGAFYMLDEDIERIRAEYPIQEKQVAERPEQKPQKLSAVPISPEIMDFLDLSKPNGKPEWDLARIEYQKELEAGIEAKCTSCKLNSIKTKYIKLLQNAKS